VSSTKRATTDTGTSAQCNSRCSANRHYSAARPCGQHPCDARIDRPSIGASVFRLDETLKVYLHREPIDFRLNINGLALLVDKALGLDPFAPCVYVFSNRRRNRVKLLGWDRNGFWLLLKRLEQRFTSPASSRPRTSRHLATFH
jgi:transposase